MRRLLAVAVWLGSAAMTVFFALAVGLFVLAAVGVRGPLISLVGLFTDGSAYLESESNFPAYRFLLMAMTLLLAVHRCERWMRRAGAAIRLEEVSADVTPDVLLLRHFEQDNRVEVVARPGQFEDVTLEEALVEGLEEAGRKVIAVHDPRRGMPPIGARRVRLDPDRWQEEVLELAGRARAVLVAAGLGPGIRSEMQLLAQDEAILAKVVIVVCASNDASLYMHWANVLTAIGSRAVPAQLEATTAEDTASLAALLETAETLPSVGASGALLRRIIGRGPPMAAYGVKAVRESGCPDSALMYIHQLVRGSVIGMTFHPRTTRWSNDTALRGRQPIDRIRALKRVVARMVSSLDAPADNVTGDEDPVDFESH